MSLEQKRAEELMAALLAERWLPDDVAAAVRLGAGYAFELSDRRGKHDHVLVTSCWALYVDGFTDGIGGCRRAVATVKTRYGVAMPSGRQVIGVREVDVLR